MMRTTLPIIFMLSLLCIAGGGCKKYLGPKDVASPAYIRVFNMITNTPNIFHNGESNTFLAFLMDPVLDKSNIPSSAAIVGDYIASRQLFVTSYPTDAANTVVGAGYVNYEYPGREHVLTAPSINGFDCSSWAQIPSGKHRIMFVSRPPNETPFDSLTLTQRSQIIADTVIDFQEGELHTLEAVLQDIGTNKYGAYLRKEEFTHRKYSDDSLYVGVYKVCASIPGDAASPFSPIHNTVTNWFADTLSVSGTYYQYDYLLAKFDTVPYGHDGFSISGRFSGEPSYLHFPKVPESTFFDLQGNPGLYGPNAYNRPGVPAAGTLPTINILVGGFGLYFWYPANMFMFGPWENYEVLPNLNLLTINGKTMKVYPTVNFLEIVNDRVYITRVQRGFSQVP